MERTTTEGSAEVPPPHTLIGAVSVVCRRDTLGYLCHRAVLRRNVLIAVVVGTLLSLVNELDLLLRGPVTSRLLMKIAANFMIPFVVSSISVAVNRGRAGAQSAHAGSLR